MILSTRVLSVSTNHGADNSTYGCVFLNESQRLFSQIVLLVRHGGLHDVTRIVNAQVLNEILVAELKVNSLKPLLRLHVLCG